jgi:hypothetical protein
MSCEKCKKEEMVTIPYVAHKIVIARKEREKNRLKVALAAITVVSVIEAVIIVAIMLH